MRGIADRLWARTPLTNDQWKKIKKSFERVGVDADKAMAPQGLLGYGYQPLRQALPNIALECAAFLQIHKGAPTAKKLAAEQSDIIKLCNDLHTWLGDPRNLTPYDFSARQHLFRIDDLALRMRADLETLVATLECCRDKLAMGSSQGTRNRKAHNKFWEELTRVWHDNVGKNTKWTASVDLGRFLIACSAPFFPKETTDKKISTFIERYAASSK